MALRLIADDAGALAAIDEGITELIARQMLDGVAIFANWPNIRCAVPWIGSGCDLGIHLNISTGPPVLPPADIPTLVDEHTGAFVDPRDEVGASPSAKIEAYLENLAIRLDQAQVAAEFEAQLQVFEETLGQPPAFVSVHHDLDLVSTVRAAADSIGSGKCRQSRLQDGTLSGYDYRLHGEDSTDQDVLEYFLDALDPTARTSGDHGIAEIVCHPARRTHGLESLSIYRTQRVQEFSALMDPRCGQLRDGGG